MKKTSEVFLLLKKESVFLAILFLISFLIRLMYTLQIQDLPPLKILVMDAQNFHMLATEILQTGWLGKSNFFIDPFYPYFIALIYKIYGINFFPVRVIQIFLGALTPVLIYYVGKNFFDRRIGVLASLIVACYRIFIFFTPLFLKPTVYLFFEALFLFYMVLYINKGKKYFLFFAGLFLGIMTLTRGNTYIVLPLIVTWLIVREYKSGLLPIIQKTLLLMMGLFLIFVPFIIRNYLVTGNPALLSSCGGFNFYIGNNQDASGLYQPLIEGRQIPLFEKNDMKELAEREAGKQMSYAQASQYWLSKSLHWITRNPVDFIRLYWQKLRIFFNHYEIPDTEDYYLYRQYSSVLNMPFISFGLLCPFALLGLFLARRKWKELSLLYVFILANIISVLLFFIFSRFRLPTVLLLIFFAASSILWLWDSFKARTYSKVLVFSFLFMLIYMLVNSNLPVLQGLSASSHFMLADSFRKTGDLKKAIFEYEKALEINPQYVKVINNLALVDFEVGEIDHSIQLLNKAIDIDPHYMSARSNLSKIYSIQGDIDKAIEVLEKAIIVDSENTAINARLEKLRQIKDEHTVVD